MTTTLLPNVYAAPNVVRVEGVFRDANGNLTDPSTVVAKYRTPTTGTVTTKTYGSDAEVVKDGTGRYHIDISATVVGDWFYAFLGDSAKLEGFFRVRPSALS